MYFAGCFSETVITGRRELIPVILSHINSETVELVQICLQCLSHCVRYLDNPTAICDKILAILYKAEAILTR